VGEKSWHRNPAAVAAMMELEWTSKALSDLVRLYDFLAPVNKQAAAPHRAITDHRTGTSQGVSTHRRKIRRVRTA
jgi:plasmid stabilization system protein ParE